jgi:phosphate transport system ATP-binding protein
MESKTHISIKNLSVWYGEQQAVNNVNIDIPDKKITAIIGPSGCGKTTLLKSLNRLLDDLDGVKVTGEVIVDEEDIYTPNAELIRIRKKMGLLSQKPQVLPMSIYENVAYGLRIHGVKGKKLIKRVNQLEKQCPFFDVCPEKVHIKKGKEMDFLIETYLRIVGLWDEVKKRLHSSAAKLSIGQQQRLCLARALAVEPEIILADEPTSALDPLSSQNIERLLVGLKKDYTIVVVTHILRQAKRLADYIIFLYLGEIIEYGPAEQIFENPKEELTKEYLKGIIS